MTIIFRRFMTAADMCAPDSARSDADIAAARVRLATACYEAQRTKLPADEAAATAARQHLENLLNGETQ